MRNTRVFCMNAGGRRDMLADVWCRKQPSLTFFFSPSPLTGDCAFESLKELQSSSKLEFHGHNNQCNEQAGNTTGWP